MTPDQSLGDRELDERIRRSRRSFITGMTQASTSRRASPTSARELVACRATFLPACWPRRSLTRVTVSMSSSRCSASAMLAAELQSLVGGQVQYAAEALLRARDQLLAWSLSGTAAAAAFAAARDALGQADLMARVSTGHSLDAGDDLASLLDQLEHAVISLLPPPGRDGDPGQARTNRHRRDDPPSGQRRAGGSSP